MATTSAERPKLVFRKLRFQSIAECRQEIECILEADRAGSLETVGRWTAGQIMAHVAAWIEYGYSGYPIRAVPFFVRWLLKLQLRKILRSGMSPGVKIPGVQGGTTGMDEIPTEEAAKRLLRALDRLERGEEALYPSPAFGAMSHADRVRLNLRHAELHLGFVHYA